MHFCGVRKGGLRQVKRVLVGQLVVCPPAAAAVERLRHLGQQQQQQQEDVGMRLCGCLIAV